MVAFKVGAAAGVSEYDHVAATVAKLQRRRDLMQRAVDAAPGIDCVPVQGAFYAFPRLHGVDDDAAAHVVGSGHDGQGVGAHVETELEAAVEDAREALDDVVAREIIIELVYPHSNITAGAWVTETAGFGCFKPEFSQSGKRIRMVTK